jgi:tetratricopeptide (TPR) repeat protein
VDWDRAHRPAALGEVRAELCAVYRDAFGEPSPWAELPDVSLEADGWNNRGVSYLYLGHEDRAAECFTQALSVNPAHLEATYNRALLAWRRAEIDDQEVLVRLERLRGAAGVDDRQGALALAEVHQERYDPDSAQAVARRVRGKLPGAFRGARVVARGRSPRASWPRYLRRGRRP